MRFDQNPERGFDGRIDEEGALAVGEFRLVSTNRLIREARNVKAEIDAAGNPVDLDYKEACDAVVAQEHLEQVLANLARRNYRRINKMMGRTYAGGTLLKRVAQYRFFGKSEEAPDSIKL